jgi:hypothetical protein
LRQQEGMMGLRDKIKKKVKKAINNLSGEYSSEAPNESIPYERGVTDENAEVVMAKLNRPKGTVKNSDQSSS